MSVKITTMTAVWTHSVEILLGVILVLAILDTKEMEKSAEVWWLYVYNMWNGEVSLTIPKMFIKQDLCSHFWVHHYYEAY